MFRNVYDSAWYQPIFFWLAGIALLVAVTRRLPFLYAYLVAFTLEILADVTLTGAGSPVPPNGRLAGALGLIFIVLGDARYFVLVARARSCALTARTGLVALGLALIVPALSYVAERAFPSAHSNARVLYLVYELMFVVLAVVMRAWIARSAWPREADPAARRTALLATHFEIAQYGLWAMADVVILTGHDAGYALRLVPNAMYYAMFLPFVAWAAPRALREPWRESRA